MRKIKIKSILAAVAGLFLATSCSSSFLDTDPTDAVSSEKVPVPENAAALVNGAWYNLFDYSSTYANIGYRALQCQDDMMASDVVSRPKYGFNSSYQFNDIALSSNSRTHSEKRTGRCSCLIHNKNTHRHKKIVLIFS